MWHDHYFHHPRFLQSHQLPSSFPSNHPHPSGHRTVVTAAKISQNPIKTQISGSANLRFLRFLADVAMDVTTPRGASLVLGAVLVPWGAQKIDIIDHLYVAFKAVRMKFRLLQWLFSSFRLKACLEIEFGPETWDKCSLRALFSERNRRWFNVLAGLESFLGPSTSKNSCLLRAHTCGASGNPPCHACHDVLQTSQSARSFYWPGWHCTTSRRGRWHAGIVMQCVTFHDLLLKRVCISGLEHVATESGLGFICQLV